MPFLSVPISGLAYLFYDFNKKSYNVFGKSDLTNSQISISQLNYIKNAGKKSKIDFNFNFIPKKYMNIKDRAIKILYLPKPL